MTEIEETVDSWLKERAHEYVEYVGRDEAADMLAWAIECNEKNGDVIEGAVNQAKVALRVDPVRTLKTMFIAGYAYGRKDALEADLKSKINL